MKFPLKAAAPGLLCVALAVPGFSQNTHRATRSTNSAQIAHGEYLVKGIAGCGDCHTPMNNRGEPIAGQWLKGSPLSFKPAVPFPAWAPVAPGNRRAAGYGSSGCCPAADHGACARWETAAAADAAISDEPERCRSGCGVLEVAEVADCTGLKAPFS